MYLFINIRISTISSLEPRLMLSYVNTEIIGQHKKPNYLCKLHIDYFYYSFETRVSNLYNLQVLKYPFETHHQNKKYFSLSI